MAKRRRLNKSTQRERGDTTVESGSPLVSGVGGLNPLAIAIGMLAGAIVYVSYYPSDSVAVEKGDALWLAVLAVIIATIACAARSWQRTNATELNESRRPGAAEIGDGNETNTVATSQMPGHRQLLRLATLGLDVLPWLLAGWMMLAAFASSPPGNLRMATNEAWFWLTAACLFTAARILLVSLSVRQSILGLLVICASGLAVHGMHQHLVSLPENRAEYQRDPEAVLQKAMLDAPPGSAERMVFENRLMDGGPTATFALANSLAAVLLFSVVLASGGLVFGWRRLHPAQRVGWVLVVLLCVAGLMAARSRSATLAMLFAWALLLIVASRVFDRRRRMLGWGLFGLIVVGAAGVALLAILGNREWFEEAPASLAFRFQYWRSTWQMVLDRPLFGAGPGNFQAIYERYRESSATEQIAEPHNFLMETLAAGGFIGLGLLLLLGLCALIVRWFREAADGRSRVSPRLENQGEAESRVARSRVSPRLENQGEAERSVGLGETDLRVGFDSDEAPSDSLLARWVWLGAIVALGLIWILGWISRQPPDLEASRYVIPAVLLIAWLVVTSVDKIASRDLDVLFGIAMIAILIHLMISGGWTVPGVAIVIWLSVGMLTRCTGGELSARSGTRDQTRTIAVVAIGLLLLLALWAFSLRPVEQRRVLMARAADAQARGRLETARESLLLAADVDPWSPEATLWLADFYRWRLVLDGDTPQARRRWEEALEDVKGRAGQDPAIYRMIGAQQLHIFQRWGEQRDLDAAAQSFQAALGWSPANQWMFAQMAAIERAQGNTEAAAGHAKMADQLSRQGGNIERALSRQMVYIPEKLAVSASGGPIRVAANRLLVEPNDRPPRKSPD